jgi:flagellar protein FlbT
MSGLVLKLAPNERILINGAVIENGIRRSRLNIVTPGAHILRLRDAIHPDEAKTPVRRVCYIAQLLLSGEVAPLEGEAQLRRGIEQLVYALVDPASRRELDAARAALDGSNVYQALKALRRLMPVEDMLLRRTA